MPSAYLLVSHGSRDPRPQNAMDWLAQLLRKQARSCKLEAVNAVEAVYIRGDSYSQSWINHGLVAPPVWEPIVGTAYLELSPVPLQEQIKQFGTRAKAVGCNRLQVMPVFLLPGVHVMEDIPATVAIAQEALGQEFKIDLRPHLGSHLGLSHLLANKMAAVAVDSWILLAHGSSRAGSTPPVEALAANLGAIAAYWSSAPGLELRVQELVSAGHRQIGILPYFLFAGGITDAIAKSVEEIKVQFPTTSFHLAEPVGASAELADLIWDLMGK